MPYPCPSAQIGGHLAFIANSVMRIVAGHARALDFSAIFTLRYSRSFALAQTLSEHYAGTVTPYRASWRSYLQKANARLNENAPQPKPNRQEGNNMKHTKEHRNEDCQRDDRHRFDRGRSVFRRRQYG